MLKYLSLIIKGIAMGAADVVPGVSGGTIAFMTGIYEKLISSIKSIDHIAFGLLLKGNIKLFWEKINGSFLISVFGGVMISILSLARLMEYLLVNHPIPLWSFFFGLIIASSFFILKHIEKWNFATIFSLIAGIAIAVWISIVSPAQTTEALWFVFLSGMVAICAMILPGISGSFILLLMGKYAFMMTAIKDFDLVVLLVFIAGAAIGIISFSHLLSWLLKRFYSLTIAILSGFMAGSLVKVWPWKTQSLRFEGLDYPTSPSNYEVLSGNDPQIVWAVIFLSSGVLLVLTIEFIAKKMRN